MAFTLRSAQPSILIVCALIMVSALGFACVHSIWAGLSCALTMGMILLFLSTGYPLDCFLIRRPTTGMMTIKIVLYLARIALLALLMWAIAQMEWSSHLQGIWMGYGAVVSVVMWTIGLIVTDSRRRQPIYDRIYPPSSCQEPIA